MELLINIILLEKKNENLQSQARLVQRLFFSAVPFGFIAAMAFYKKKPYIVTACLNGIEFHLDFTIRYAWVPKGCNHFLYSLHFKLHVV